MIIRCIISDIEGTITSIHFVHKVLFPYAKAHINQFVKTNLKNPEVQKALQSAAETIRQEGGIAITEDYILEHLNKWIDEDRKQPALKALQGMLWRAGYEKGEYKGHIFPDVLPALAAWKESDIHIGTYSSSSIESQKLLFKYSEAGDLRKYISRHFDTSTGPKQSVNSYKDIIRQTNFLPSEMLFLSDTEAELDAARAAGLRTFQLIREGTKPGLKHPHAKTFSDVRL